MATAACPNCQQPFLPDQPLPHHCPFCGESVNGAPGTAPPAPLPAGTGWWLSSPATELPAPVVPPPEPVEKPAPPTPSLDQPTPEPESHPPAPGKAAEQIAPVPLRQTPAEPPPGAQVFTPILSPPPTTAPPPTPAPSADSSHIPAVLGAVAVGLGVLGFAAAWSGQVRIVGLALGGLALLLGSCALLASLHRGAGAAGYPVAGTLVGLQALIVA